MLSSEPEPLTGVWLQPGPAVEGDRPDGSIPSRAAENLWWLGRYAERAEAVTRLLRTVQDRRNEFQGSASPPGRRDAAGAARRADPDHRDLPGFAGDGAEERVASPAPSCRR